MLTKTGAVFLVIAILALAGVGAIGVRDLSNRVVVKHAPAAAKVVTAPTATATPTADPSPTPTPAPPQSVLIQTVPFTVQAPNGVWAGHEDYCEAAATYMVGQYFAGDHRANIPPAEADAAMGRIVAWERQNFPGQLNLSLADMIQVGAQFYGLKGQIVPASFQTIEQETAAGLPVIIPVMTHGGPGNTPIFADYGADNVYHVIVVVGYNAPQHLVVTNDAGVSQGLQLAYQWSVLQTANLAQTQLTVDGSGSAVPQQGAVMLVFSR
ncbi:MAG TPA: C39 family peptidase [Candidatus Dormibacteraeota bacterium]|jgi:hypothetical protein|nr:C39 family peptidase [Candidatus Dormibacteraeota bacterium]